MKKKRQRGNSASTYDIIALNVIRLSPCAHDPRIVECNDGHDIDALALQLAEVLDVAGEMSGGAAGGECAGDGEEDDFFVGPFCVLGTVSLCAMQLRWLELCKGMR
jgi:hypothetical protein